MTSSVADALVGRVIDGRYRIISHLADGGMASVYVAMDARLDREVAVKIMRPGLAADQVFVERFRSEARSAARLSHPNVVAVFDQGDDDGDVFLAMELVEGKTLREVIHEEAPLTAREALAILEPILLALRAAHTAGIIHRDVKPENVIVRRDGEVKVADFGLARAITNQTTTSQTGVLLGTVSYLSPEQVERGSADTRSDVYAAGLLLFEMLTGRKAVTGDTPIQIAYKHVHGSIDVPSSVVPTVPAELDALVARATALEPDHRFASAAEFVGALRSTRRDLGADELDRRGRAVTAAAGATAPVAESPWPLPGPVTTAHTQPTPTEAREHTAVSGIPQRSSQIGDTAALPLGPARRRRRWPWWLAAALLVLGGAGVGAAWWLTAGPGAVAVVPVAVGQPLPAVEAAFAQAAVRPETAEAFSETVDKGIVISATPRAGSEVGKQSTVRLLVSKGPERYVVPTLVGTKSADAASLLTPLTLKLGEAELQYSESVAAGLVIAQQPPAGASVKRSAPVALVVSRGRQPLDVPDVRGAAAVVATARITKVGLTVERGADVNSDTVLAGRVVSQSPASGSLFRGQPVTIVVSKGPVLVQVPGVVGRPTAAAERTLKALGFQVTIEAPFGRLFDLVRVQSVAGGQSVRKGSTIVLTIV